MTTNVTPSTPQPVAPPAPTPAPAPAPAPTDAAAPASDTSAPVAAPPEAPTDASAPAKPEVPAAPEAPTHHKVINLRDEYDRGDKDHDGALTKSELKLLDPHGEAKRYDNDKDGKVSRSEYRHEYRRENSFEGLDGDRDGQLSDAELGKMRRYTTEAGNAFDGDGDGRVSKAEFTEAALAEKRENREAVRAQEFEHLSGKERHALEKDKRYDADGDGKMTLDEYRAGHKAEWKAGREKKIEHLFEAAGAKGGQLDAKQAKEYAAYDADGDGTITKAEFKEGHLADRKDYWKQVVDKGDIGAAMRKRLGLNQDGFGLNHIDKQAQSVGSSDSPWKPGSGQLHGADTSHYQSDATFADTIDDERFSAIKSSQGTGYVDPTFKERWDAMGDKIEKGDMDLRVAYHFLDSGNGAGQAKHFLDTLGIDGPLPAGTRLALDWEADALNSPGTLKDAADYVHKVTGTWPLIYVQGSKESVAKATVPEAPIWRASWSSHPGTDVPFVQYSDGPVYDHNVFNGDRAALRRFAGFTD